VTRRPERVEFDHAVQALRKLLRDWDPIGVYEGDPNYQAPEGEYDAVIPGLYKRLRTGVGEDELVAFLGDHDYGLPPRPEADRRLARELLAWWAEREPPREH
jgi:hypothetical protein